MTSAHLQRPGSSCVDAVLWAALPSRPWPTPPPACWFPRQLRGGGAPAGPRSRVGPAQVLARPPSGPSLQIHLQVPADPVSGQRLCYFPHSPGVVLCPSELTLIGFRWKFPGFQASALPGSLRTAPPGDSGDMKSGSSRESGAGRGGVHVPAEPHVSVDHVAVAGGRADTQAPRSCHIQLWVIFVSIFQSLLSHVMK